MGSIGGAVTTLPAAVEIPQDVQPLFEPLKVGNMELQHRIVYAPLTRCRAIGTVPIPEMATYYGQRANPGGLIISEATCITPAAHGYPHTPGIYTQEQLEAWKPVVKAVKDKGGLFYCQLWHCGRASHQDYQADGGAPVSASDIPIGDPWTVYTLKGGPFPYPAPRPLEVSEIRDIVQQYVQAAKNSIELGFDGVEIHGANGYLLDQFLKDGSNKRTDEYGGSIPNRARFHLEVVKAVCDAIGSEKVGLRLSPFNTFLDCIDSTPYDTNDYLLKELNKLKLAYVHLVEPRAAAGNEDVEGLITDSLAPFKKVSEVPFIAAGGYKRDDGAEAVRSGHADMVCYGRIYLANPDLPKRFILNAPLNMYDRNTFYSQGIEGYLDYPFLEDEE